MAADFSAETGCRLVIGFEVVEVVSCGKVAILVDGSSPFVDHALEEKVTFTDRGVLQQTSHVIFPL